MYPCDGFTLAELLVVIGVVALLVVLMVPAMAGAADRSKRTRCQNNLRQIAMGATIYAGNNNGSLFTASPLGISYPPRTVQVYIRGQDVNAISAVGLRFETNGVWTCPNLSGRPAYNASTDVWLIGYQYFGGMGIWQNSLGNFASRSPVNLNTVKPHWALAADVVMKAGSSWTSTGGIAHGTGDSALPQGGNHAFVDGSVQWIQAEGMYFLSSWNISSVRAYWYQDPEDFDASLKGNLPALRFAP